MNTASIQREQSELSERLEHGRQGYHDTTAAFVADGIIGATVDCTIAADTDHANGWLEPEEIRDGPFNTKMAKQAEFLSAILRWFAEAATPNALALRAGALVIAVRPDFLPEDRQSQSGMAKWFQKTKQALSKRVSELVLIAHGNYQHGRNCAGRATRKSNQRTALERHRRNGATPHPEKRKKL